MKKFLLIFCLLLVNSSFTQTLIPYPESFKQFDGVFKITNDTKIYYSDDSFKEDAKWFSDYIYGTTGILLTTETIKGYNKLNGNIVLQKFEQDYKHTNEEAYTLIISDSMIIINSFHRKGIFYGFQTLRQMLPADLEVQKPIDKVIPLEVKCCIIQDEPAFKWRGMLLDCCRHFMNVNFIKRYIDLLALHKMNKFHWHLTDDQGWRIEIKKYPLLTKIGSYRKEKDGTIYGGFYTQEEIKDVVHYAAQRNIDVIPEIELPGHSLAALASYPELSCTGGPFEVTPEWGVFKDIFCVGNEKTFEFLDNVLNEVIELFPYNYIHIGGDEAPKYRWENCQKCQTRMRIENLKSGEELQSYFIKRIDSLLSKKGKNLIGWDEILEGGLSPNSTVQSWRGFEGGIHSAKSNHFVIMSPTSHCYFDYGVNSIDLRKVYFFDPIPKELSTEESKFILGGECNMWTEYAPQDLIDSKIFPRILAMSEVLWTYPKEKDYDNFIARVRNYYARMNFLGIKYGYETVPVKFVETYLEGSSQIEVELITGQPNLSLLYMTSDDYTLRGYASPINVDKDNTIYVKVNSGFLNDTNIYFKSYVMNSAIGKKINIINSYSQNYQSKGKSSLIDGILGSINFRDGNWQGYNKVDLEVIIDLGNINNINELSSGFLQSNPSWIFLPEYVEYSISENNVDYLTLPKIINDVPLQEEKNIIKRFDITNININGRYIKVVAKNIGVCPDWHNGAGGAAWIFCDEIIIK